MANFRKSFNFRNGVQVDEDNFIVNSAGLVGIGTSVPTEFLDVRGSLKVVGLATVQDAFIGVATVQNNLEVGITSFSSGIITAKTGIVTYYGDARYLQGMPTSQWVDIDVGLGYTSIYAAGNVGVGTVDPRFTFQVGGNNNVLSFTNGVGINSSGDVIVAGIATITKMYGWGIGVTGLNAGDAIATGTLHNDRLPSNISISGILTSGSLLTGAITASGDVTTGAITASGSLSASGNLSVTGIATVSSDLTVLGSITGTASTARSITGSPDLVVGVVTATKLIANTIEVPSTGITTVSKLLHVGTGGTAFAALESGRLGVGTALPTRSLQIVENTDAAIELISESGECKIIFGQQVLPSVGAGDSSAVLRFGNADKTFDIIHNDTGNLNMYLHAGAAGIDTGRFNWVYGQSNAELMSLTYGGRLGIGKSNPDHNLHVVGTSTVTENAYIGQNLYVAGNIVGSIEIDPVITSNVNATTGISTFKNIEVLNNGGKVIIGTGSSLGIATDRPIVDLDVRVGSGLFARIGINTEETPQQELTVRGSARVDSIGIATDPSGAGYGILLASEFEQTGSTSYFYNSSVYVYGQSGVGVGTTAARSAVDFADAGRENPGLLPGESVGSRAYFLPPQNSSTQRVGLVTERGAIIFNTSTNKFQGYTGTTWVDFH